MGNFKVRDRYHDIEGEFSEEEILGRIAKGLYTGEEEVASPPFVRWHKLSSYPGFYDALLKRLYEESYEPPQDPVGDGILPEDQGARPARKERADQATRQEEVAQNPSKDPGEDGSEELGKTEQLGAGPVKESGATIHQSVIDELFSEVNPVEEKPEGGAPILLSEPLDISMPVGEPVTANPEALTLATANPEALTLATANVPSTAFPPPVRPSRRPVIYGALLILLLVLLFQMGKGGDPSQEPSGGAAIAKQGLTNSPVEEPEATKPKVQSLITEAESLFSNGSPVFYRGALEILREALALEEKNVRVLEKISQVGGRVLQDESQPETLKNEIREWIRQGRVSDPQSDLFYQAEALIFFQEGKFTESKRYILNGIEANPGNGEDSLILGDIHYALGDLQAAQRSYQAAVKTPTVAVRAHASLSRIAYETRDFATARTEGLEALRLNPFETSAYLELAETASEQNQLKEAKGLYETAGRLARFGSIQGTARAFFRLGSLQDISGNKKLADQSFLLSYYYASSAGHPSQELLDRLKAVDKDPVKLKALAEASEFGPGYLTLQGDGFLREGKTGEALKFYQAAHLLSPEDASLLVKVGEALEKKASSFEDFRQVMNVYERAIAKDPEAPHAYIRLGSLETDQYNLGRGFRLLNQALALSPDKADPYVALGKHYYKRQDYSESLNQFLKAAKMNPTDSEILFYAGQLRLMFKKESAREAMGFFYRSYLYNPQNYEALVEWLKLKVTTHDKNFAIKFLRNLLQADPGNANLYWAYGEVYAANNEPQKAIDFYHKSLDIDNRSSRVRIALARALESIGELDKAVAEYRLASDLDPRNGEGFYRAAMILTQLKNYPKAEETLQKLMSMAPNYPGVHRELSQVYRIKNQKELAMTEMETEVMNNPQNAKYHIELAELYLQYEKPEKAIAELSKVTNLPPVTKAPEFVYDKIRAYLLLSRTYRSQSRFENAEGAIKLALEMDSNDPQLHLERGFVYYGQHRDKEAVKEFEVYLSRNPAAENAPNVKNLIRQLQIED